MNTKINIGNAITAFAAIGMISCSTPSEVKTAGPVPVTMEEVKQEAIMYHDVYPGNVIALNEVQIRSEVNGFISGIYFQEGQTVRKGQKLYEIEQEKFAAAYTQADANLQIARANFEKAKNDAERYNRLGEQGMATKQKVEYSEVDFQNARSQVAAAEAQLQRAAADLKHATITAPFEGTIGISQVKLGAFISAGQTLLNTISSDDPIGVDFVISEREIGRFNQLRKQPSAVRDSLFSIVLPDKTVYAYPGTVELFDRAVDPQTGTLKIRLRFPNPQHSIRAGMSCNVRVLNKNTSRQAVIPYKAVTEQMGEFFVYVVEQDTARQQKVTLGTPVNNRVIIREGLTEGQRIVVDGIQKLKNGVAVQDAKLQPAPASAK